MSGNPNNPADWPGFEPEEEGLPIEGYCPRCDESFLDGEIVWKARVKTPPVSGHPMEPPEEEPYCPLCGGELVAG